MKTILELGKRLLPKGIFANNPENRTPAPDKGTQILLSLKYKELLHHGMPLPRFDEVGFRIFSDNDEDGILLYIFSLISTKNKTVVDIGSGGIQGSNSANLIISHGWNGLLIDGNPNAVQELRNYFSGCIDTQQYPPKIIRARVTKDNINNLIEENGISGEIDLLLIDIDGIDYWIWQAVECISPRVVVVEYQDILGPDKALTIPYRPDFQHLDFEVNQEQFLYVGASLPAFMKLGKEKGYRLVGCNKYGYNAFFIRRDLGSKYLPAVPAHSCFTHPWNQFGIQNLYPKVKDMDWVEV